MTEKKGVIGVCENNGRGCGLMSQLFQWFSFSFSLVFPFPPSLSSSSSLRDTLVSLLH